LLVCLPVHAETAASAVIAFDIPAGSLQAALVAFASQSRLQLIYPPEAVAGRNVVAMRASLPVRAALQRLIEDAGLRIRQVDARQRGTWTRRARAAKAAAVDENWL
jgi:hypothetical protein